jgi:hypothetical protein
VITTLETKTLFVGLLVGLAHIISGIAVMADTAALNVTPLASLHSLAEWLGYDKGGFVGATLLLAGLMAVVGGNLKAATPKIVHGVLFLPQQTLLMLQIWTITVALVEGRYPDGYIPLGGAWFIVTDQIWAFVLATSHSIWLAAFLYGDRRGTNGVS